MKRVLWTVVTLVLMVVIAMPDAGHAQTSKRDDIRKLMDLTKASAIGQQMADAMRPVMENQLKVSLPKMPLAAREMWLDEVEKGFRDKIPELMDKLLPIYDREFSHDQIKGLLAFYDTPLGRKAIEKMPTILRESMALGRRWGGEVGRRLGAKAMETVRGAGYDPNTFK